MLVQFFCKLQPPRTSWRSVLERWGSDYAVEPSTVEHHSPQPLIGKESEAEPRRIQPSRSNLMCSTSLIPIQSKGQATQSLHMGVPITRALLTLPAPHESARTQKSPTRSIPPQGVWRWLKAHTDTAAQCRKYAPANWALHMSFLLHARMGSSVAQGT